MSDVSNASLADVLDGAIRLRDQLDDETDPDRAEGGFREFYPLAEVFFHAHRLGIARASEIPDQPISREGARRKLDGLIPLLRDRLAREREEDNSNPEGAEDSGVGRADASAVPEWIYQHFRQKQQQLLLALWRCRLLPATNICEVLGYADPATALDNLHRTVSRAVSRLTERAGAIGGQWEIVEQTRDGVLHYHLRQVSGDPGQK